MHWSGVGRSHVHRRGRRRMYQGGRWHEWREWRWGNELHQWLRGGHELLATDGGILPSTLSATPSSPPSSTYSDRIGCNRTGSPSPIIGSWDELGGITTQSNSCAIIGGNSRIIEGHS